MNETPFLHQPNLALDRYDTHIENKWVAENSFIPKVAESIPLPSFEESRSVLPDPFWAANLAAIDCYWRAWELAFGNLKQPTTRNRFISNYCDSAFNGNLFLWDSAFITAFGLYGRRAFEFEHTLDNFYHKQHADGFICREIEEDAGLDCFQRFDPSSTGPNVLAWAEWNFYQHTGSRQRLAAVFPALVAYHQWMRANHTWQDGSYWSTGWGCGMDNLPRLADEKQINWGHGHLTWVDATFQAILSAKTLLRIASLFNLAKEVTHLEQEAANLTAYANASLWDKRTHFYYDRAATGELSRIKHIGAFWSLLAGCPTTEQAQALAEHLENPDEFNRRHRVPALSGDDPGFKPDGGYWCGGVWAPTNYMVIQGLHAAGFPELAYRIGANHHENVVKVYQSDTRWADAERFSRHFHLAELKYDDLHTLWENYAPDAAAPGGHSKPGYVGWSGLAPVAILFEEIFGLRPDAPHNKLTWRVRQINQHGVRRYPFGQHGLLDLSCAARTSPAEKPILEIKTNIPITFEVIWEGGKEIVHLVP